MLTRLSFAHRIREVTCRDTPAFQKRAADCLLLLQDSLIVRRFDTNIHSHRERATVSPQLTVAGSKPHFPRVQQHAEGLQFRKP